MNLQEIKKCSSCLGNGEVSVMEKVYPGEPHVAPIGVEKCEECNGTGIETDEETLIDRVFDSITPDEEKKLVEYLIEDVNYFNN